MPRTKSDIFVATESFSAEVDGVLYSVNVGERVREGHGLLKSCPDAFERMSDQPVTYDVEDASASPGSRRGQQ
jgi:hypothetical protein